MANPKQLPPELVKALADLDADGLSQVRSMVDTLTGTTSPDILNTPLFQAMTKRVGFVVVSSAARTAWLKNHAAAEKWIKDTFKARTRMGELAISSLLVEILADDLIRRGIPVSLKTLGEHLPRLREVFEYEFPGYIKSGMVKVIMDRLTGGKDGKDRTR